MQKLNIDLMRQKKDIFSKYNFYFADTETTTIKNYDLDHKVQIIIAGAQEWGLDHNDKIQTKSGFELVNKIYQDNRKYKTTLRKNKQLGWRFTAQKAVVYFHNLKFDASFIRNEFRKINGLVLTANEFHLQRRFLDELSMCSVNANQSVKMIQDRLDKHIKRQQKRYAKSKNGYEVPEVYLKDNFFTMKDASSVLEYMKMMQWCYSDVITPMGSVYMSSIVAPDMSVIELRDSMKIFNQSIASLAPTVGMQKSKDWDYEQYRDPKTWKPSKDELYYFWTDIDILTAVMTKFILQQNQLRLTISGYAEDTLASITDRWLSDFDDPESNELSEDFKNLFSDKAESLSPVKPRDKYFWYHSCFNSTKIEFRDQIQSAYFGGIVYRKPSSGRYLESGPGRVYDANSMYPGVMRNYDYPYGEAIWKSGKPQHVDGRPDYIVYFYAKFMKREDTKDRVYVPFLPKKWSLNGEVVNSDQDLKPGYHRMALSNVDFENFKQEYDIQKIKYIGAYYWATIKKPFSKFVNHWASQKEQAKREIDEALKDEDQVKFQVASFNKSYSKLMLNSPYGKFAQKTLQSETVVDIGFDGVGRNKSAGWSARDGYYLPAAIFITAYARKTLLEAVRAVGGRFMYCDTDSVHITGKTEPKGLDVDSARLGAWKVESEFEAARYVRAKCYVEQTDDGHGSTYPLVKFAGLNKVAASKIETVDQLRYTDERPDYDGVTFSNQVSGGTLLTDGSKQMLPKVSKIKSTNFDEDEVEAIKVVQKRILSSVHELSTTTKSEMTLEDVYHDIRPVIVTRIRPYFTSVVGLLSYYVEQFNDLNKNYLVNKDAWNNCFGDGSFTAKDAEEKIVNMLQFNNFYGII